MTQRISVLIIDDSPTVREHLTNIVNRDPDLVVIGQAANGVEAVRLTQKLKPQVVSIDIHMPIMDGFEAVREIMRIQPTPIVMMSGSLEGKEAAVAFDAIKAGALTVIKKPPAQSHPEFHVASQDFCNTLRLMSDVAVIHRWSNHPSIIPTSRNINLQGLKSSIEVIGIASSTGGPSALVEILAALPPSFPIPIVVTQHISRGFEGGLVDWLGRVCSLKVHLAQAGQPLIGGQILVAPSDKHLFFNEDKTIRLLSEDDLSSLYIPSANVMFRSIAEVFQQQALGVILTGMGDDGAAGLLAIRRAGGITIAQDEVSSVVFGMPKEAIALGAAQYTSPLKRISAILISTAWKQRINND